MSQKATKVSYNPFGRLDPVEHYAERWQRRNFSRAMAVTVGALALFVFLAQQF